MFCFVSSLYVKLMANVLDDADLLSSQVWSQFHMNWKIIVYFSTTCIKKSIDEPYINHIICTRSSIISLIFFFAWSLVVALHSYRRTIYKTVSNCAVSISMTLLWGYGQTYLWLRNLYAEFYHNGVDLTVFFYSSIKFFIICFDPTLMDSCKFRIFIVI